MYPSLNKLLESYPDSYVLNKYKNNSKQSWSLGKYYLGGQKLMSVDEPITYKDIAESTIVNADPVNSFEMASINRHRQDLSEFRDIYNEYLKETASS